MLPETTEDLPKKDVGKQVQRYINNENAAKVTAERQADGTWKVKAEAS
jgi:hypothetical protein